jgi:hypothetical protein
MTDDELVWLQRYCASTENTMLKEAFKDYPAPRTSALPQRFVDPEQEAALLDYVFRS